MVTLKLLSSYLGLVCLAIIIYALPLGAGAQTITWNNLKVTKIVDGDTIWIQKPSGERFKIRLAGINSPELSTHPAEPYAEEARSFLVNLLGGSTVYLTYDSNHEFDKYNRVLAHIYLTTSHTWVNNEMVKNGMAEVYLISRYVPRVKQLLDSETQAINSNLGMWANTSYHPILAEAAKNYIGQYKQVHSTVAQVNMGRTNIWLELGTPYEGCFKMPNQHQPQCFKRYPLAVRIPTRNPKTSIKKYATLVGKQVIIRGFVETYKSNKYPPYIKSVNPHTISIYEQPSTAKK